MTQDFKTETTMKAKTISINKTRKALAVAYNVNVNFIPEEIEDQFITYKKAA
jgi:hypothetical protein